MAGQAKGYTRNLWLTYKQAKELGGHVRKGEKSEIVILWKPAKGKDKTDANGDTEKGHTYLLIRTYRVFNVEQCEGLTLPKKFQIPEPGEDEGDDVEETTIQIDERAEGVLTTYLEREGLSMKHGGNRACYSPGGDWIQMPKREDFTDSSEYYSTAFHECGHSTGHKSRLDRDSLTKVSMFDRHTYSREELVAEFCAAFLCGVTGVALAETTENSASYLKIWASKLRDEPKLLINAAAAAQKAADYILEGPRETEATS